MKQHLALDTTRANTLRTHLKTHSGEKPRRWRNKKVSADGAAFNSCGPECQACKNFSRALFLETKPNMLWFLTINNVKGPKIFQSVWQLQKLYLLGQELFKSYLSNIKPWQTYVISWMGWYPGIFLYLSWCWSHILVTGSTVGCMISASQMAKVGKSWSQEAKGRFDFAFCPLRGGLATFVHWGRLATFVSNSRYSFYWEDRSGSFGRAAHREVPKKRLHIAGEPERPFCTA